jgi:hypothetical protein
MHNLWKVLYHIHDKNYSDGKTKRKEVVVNENYAFATAKKEWMNE